MLACFQTRPHYYLCFFFFLVKISCVTRVNYCPHLLGLNVITSDFRLPLQDGAVEWWWMGFASLQSIGALHGKWMQWVCVNKLLAKNTAMNLLQLNSPKKIIPARQYWVKGDKVRGKWYRGYDKRGNEVANLKRYQSRTRYTSKEVPNRRLQPKGLY